MTTKTAKPQYRKARMCGGIATAVDIYECESTETVKFVTVRSVVAGLGKGRHATRSLAEADLLYAYKSDVAIAQGMAFAHVADPDDAIVQDSAGRLTLTVPVSCIRPPYVHLR